MVFHVLNRANARARIFGREADYAAFERVMKETLARKPIRVLGYLIMPNHWHLVLWPEHDGELGAFMQRLTTTHVRRWHLCRKTVGCGHLYQGTYKSFPIETDEHLLTVLCYVERNALRGIGRACGGLAMVEPVALAARRSNGRRAAVDELASRTTATLAVPGEPAAGEGGGGCGADIGAAGPSFRQHDLAGGDRREAWTRIDLSASWTPEEAPIIGLIPFSVPTWRQLDLGDWGGVVSRYDELQSCRPDGTS